MPAHINPAEYMLDIISTDFSRDESLIVESEEKRNSYPHSENATARLDYIQKCWKTYEESTSHTPQTPEPSGSDRKAVEQKFSAADVASGRPAWYRIVLVLLHRSFIKSNRDVVAYGIRIAMYLGKKRYHIMLYVSNSRLFRARYYDGNGLATVAYFSGVYPAVHQCYCECSYFLYQAF